MVNPWLTHSENYLIPNWTVPDSIRAVSSLRTGGGGEAPFGSFNLGDHVGDDGGQVRRNRALLARDIGVDEHRIVWLNQIHSTQILRLDNWPQHLLPVNADGSVTDRSGIVCAVMTADCLPVLLTNIHGDQVAALHAGWRGLVDGIIEKGVREFKRSDEVIAWLGPAIGPEAFEVGADVLASFVNKSEGFRGFFVESSKADHKWYADIAGMAELTLNMLGVETVYRSNECTYHNPERFFSYRRDGVTGRMASLIWKPE